jgi:haloacid dehalogenase-like hydrolase
MRTFWFPLVRTVAVLILSASCAIPALAQDPLPSWNDTAPKKTIEAFVERVTKQGSRDFVPEAERIAVFDNDGTLWAEQPIYFQLAFALDRVKALSPQHPEWKQTEPFASLLKGDIKGALAGGEPAIFKIVMATHAGMTTVEFEKIVRDWIAMAKHQKTGRLYSKMAYQPMLELLAYLRANDFKTFIVSGGKPAGIQMQIGRHPIAAFGNSDGDLQMLQWTTLGRDGPGLGVIVHHTDAEREYAYDRQSSIGRLDKALDAAALNNWTVIDMKRDWNVIFAFQKP